MVSFFDIIVSFLVIGSYNSISKVIFVNFTCRFVQIDKDDTGKFAVICNRNESVLNYLE